MFVKIIWFLLFWSTQSLAAEESWYLGFDLGLSQSRFSGEYQESIDALNVGDDSGQGSIFGLGLHFPTERFVIPGLGGRAVIGVAITGITRSYTASVFDSSFKINFNTSILGVSYIHTFNEAEPFVGWLARADLGAATQSISIEIDIGDGIDSSDNDDEVKEDQGFGFLLGGGYGFLLGNDTRLLLHLTFMYSNVGSGGGMTGSSFSVGFNF